MNGSSTKQLTGWLILLMILLGLGSFGGIGKEITNVRRAYEPYFSQYGSLNTAVLVYQCIIFASACTALYTVWLLYRRVPGTLIVAKRGFLATVLLRMAAGWVFDLIARLPEEVRGSLRSDVMLTLILAAYGSVWYLYLTRSRRVKEIYAA